MGNNDTPIARGLPWLLAIVLVLLIIRLAPSSIGRILPVVLSAIIIAAATAPLARAMERYHIPRSITVLALYLAVALVLAGVIALMVPVITSEIELLRSALPEYSRRAQDLIARLAPGYVASVSNDRLATTVTAQLGDVLSGAAAVAFTAGSLLVQVVLVLVMAYFMVVEAEFAHRMVARFIPAAQQRRTLRMLHVIGTKLGQWARAQAIIALSFGLAFGIGLRMLGVHYAGTLGLVGAVLEIVPYIGGVVTLLLTVVVAGTQSPWLILWTVLLYVAIVQVEAHILAPALIGRSVGLHPLLVVIALFVGAETLGILGALLAVPLAVVAQVVVDEFYAAEPDARPAQTPDDDDHVVLSERKSA
jgi:predicted PurR-regulated permease PerM